MRTRKAVSIQQDNSVPTFFCKKATRPGGGRENRVLETDISLLISVRIGYKLNVIILRNIMDTAKNP